MKNEKKRIRSAILTGTLAMILSVSILAPVSASAAASATATMPTAATATAPTAASAKTQIQNSKEETVYVMLDPDGSPRNVYVINFYPSHTGELLDYGNYDSIRNLSTEDVLTQENGQITGKIGEGNFYYEGLLSQAEIPWKIEISYWLDGSPISPAEVAGKEGKVEIDIHITGNELANTAFYDHYALQISTSFQTSQCPSILAEGAVIANVGETKQVSYTLLPKKEGIYHIEVLTTNFEMGAISINALPFQMNIDFEGADSFTEAFDPLTDGIAKLDDGALKLKNGAKDLQDGIRALGSKSGSLKNGSGEVLGAITAINNALAGIQGLTGETGGIAQIKSASAAFQSGLSQVNTTLSGIAPDSEETRQFLAAMSKSTDPGVQKLVLLYQTKMDAVAQSAAALSKLNTSYAQLHAGIGAIDLNISGLSELSKAVSTLLVQYGALNKGIIQYTDGYKKIEDGYASIYSGIQDLEHGTAQLKTQTEGLNQEVKDRFDQAFDEFRGETFTPISFVSEEQTEVSAVQFVIRTSGVQVPEKPAAAAELEKKLNFGEKFLALLGLK